MAGKLIIFSAPSGSGKSTIIHQLTTQSGLQGHFSISATSRPPRGEEIDGVHYHFISTIEFQERIERGEFLEYEEVYPGCFYGTLKSEIDRALDAGETVLLDIDVKGALNVKKVYGEQALSLFILPPSMDVLRKRLEGRATDTPSKIQERLAKASKELSYAPYFDKRIVNDHLETACEEAMQIITRFLEDRKRVLLFPGSFNPMHIGHLAIANYLAEQYDHRFDEVCFLLTPTNPFKQRDELLPTAFRAEWIWHLIKDYPKLQLSLEEEKLTPPYYTYNTVQYLQQKYPNTHFSLLIGGDSLVDLPRWHRAEELLHSLPIIAYPRPHSNKNDVPQRVLEAVEVLEDVPTFNVSSTMIRSLIAKGKALPYLLNTPITHPLYRQLHEELLTHTDSDKL